MGNVTSINPPESPFNIPLTDKSAKSQSGSFPTVLHWMDSVSEEISFEIALCYIFKKLISGLVTDMVCVRKVS